MPGVELLQTASHAVNLAGSVSPELAAMLFSAASQLATLGAALWKGGGWVASINSNLKQINRTMERHAEKLDKGNSRMTRIENRLLVIETRCPSVTGHECDGVEP